MIKVVNLTKIYNDFTAVNNVSFEITKGEIFAFLGPNGAGKSTTIKMLITLIKPESGEAFINGFSIKSQSDEVRKMIGYVPQMISVDGTLSAFENLMLMARLYDIPRSQRVERVQKILEFLELDKYSKELVRTFSGGMIRKLEIGQAIIHRPPVLFLDEPTAGLDPIARRNVWKHIFELRKEFNTTIFFTTHYMEEAEEVSDRVAIISNGQIAAIDTVEGLINKTQIPEATLEDAFIHFTGEDLNNNRENFREVRHLRDLERKLG